MRRRAFLGPMGGAAARASIEKAQRFAASALTRRTFVAALGAAAAGPLAVRAEQRIPRIGYLSPVPPDIDKPQSEAFVTGLRELGYIPGKTIEIEQRFADGREDGWRSWRRSSPTSRSTSS